MSIPAKVTTYLNKAKVQFDVIAHRTVFTAYDLATTLREKLETIGKTLLIKADARYVIVVLPANRRLDLAKLKTVLQAKKLTIATEKDMVRELKVKPGAITPFGTLHHLEVVADATLLKAKKILLGAGSFTESLRIKVSDFVKIENAKLARFTTDAGLPKPVVAKPKKKPSQRPARRSPKRTAKRATKNVAKRATKKTTKKKAKRS